MLPLQLYFFKTFIFNLFPLNQLNFINFILFSNIFIVQSIY